MKPRTVAFLLISAFIGLVGCNSPTNETGPTGPGSAPATQTAATPDETALARANYARHCLACHGAEGEGGPTEIEGKKVNVPSLTEGHALKHTEEQFFKQISNGSEGMPAFKDKLSNEEIYAMVRFVRREFQGK